VCDHSVYCAVLVARHDRELEWVCADVLLLGDRHRDALGAARIAAFADQVKLLPFQIERLGKLADLLIDLAEDRFVEAHPAFVLGHRFDEVFRTEGIRVVKTPVRAPKANAIAERFVRTVRSERLDWLLILNRRHLERPLRVYVEHYDTQRPHRALKLCPPDFKRTARSSESEIHRRDRLGGLIHEYFRAAP
jgi:putative transposase